MESRIPNVYFPHDFEDQAKRPVNYEILNSPELRARYVTLTEGLISRLAENQTDVAIFLDKSARPVAWLTSELWDTLAPKDPETGKSIKKPDFKFLNIDREHWGPSIGRSEDAVGGINIDRIPEEMVEDLRAVYAPISGKSQPGDETLLTGKNVTVVDEVRMSGDTLAMSQKILQRAFPDAAEVKAAYWMMEAASRDPRSGAIVGGEVPVWYSDETNKGRLVANRDTYKSMVSNSSRQRAGAYWLSTRFRKGPDQAGRQLKAEVKQLAQDFKDHKIPYVYSPNWNSRFEKIEDRIPRLGGIGVSQYVELRKTYPEKADFIQHYSELISH